MKQTADQTRNTSLLASLEFSRRHVSPAARAALPWLSLFSGGVFEDNFLDVSQIDPAAWDPMRFELQGIALLRIENDTQIANRPFLRFHPTLAIASADSTFAENPEVRDRFVQVYRAVERMLNQMLFGSQPRAALTILDREEMNFRTAVRWAIAGGQFRTAANLGHTFREYLERSGRLRERDAWVQMLRDAVTQPSFTEEAARYERDHAWTLFSQGNPQEAVNKLQSLVERLRQTTEFDPAFQLAMSVWTLGRVLHNAGASTQAIPILREAIGLWEQIVQSAGGQSWQLLLESPGHAKAGDELGNLSAAMGDLANAILAVGEHAEALQIAENGLVINQARGDDRNTAAGHAQCASILRSAGRYDEADARYELALAAAVQAGDKDLEGSILQHRGSLANDRNQPARATHLYRQSLQLFREAGNTQAMMQTYNSLGTVELNAGRLAEARAWYEKSRELAKESNNQQSLAAAAQNIGIVCQLEGESARGQGNEAAARRRFEEARRSVEESLRIKQALHNKPGEATSLAQLARIHLGLGDLAAAERYAHEARRIMESLGLKEARPVYNTLSEIAAARGDTAAAAEWARKRDDLLAELERRAAGTA